MEALLQHILTAVLHTSDATVSLANMHTLMNLILPKSYSQSAPVGVDGIILRFLVLTPYRRVTDRQTELL